MPGMRPNMGAPGIQAQQQKVTHLQIWGCSLNFVFFFSKNCLYFATSPSPSLGCYRLYKNGQPNKSDCTLGSLARMSCSSTCRGWVWNLSPSSNSDGDGLQWIGKNTNFNEHTVLYFYHIIFICISLLHSAPQSLPYQWIKIIVRFF